MRYQHILLYLCQCQPLGLMGELASRRNVTFYSEDNSTTSSLDTSHLTLSLADRPASAAGNSEVRTWCKKCMMNSCIIQRDEVSLNTTQCNLKKTKQKNNTDTLCRYHFVFQDNKSDLFVLSTPTSQDQGNWYGFYI